SSSALLFVLFFRFIGNLLVGDYPEISYTEKLTRSPLRLRDRVALEDCSSRAPTDPDVRISRIRLFDLRIRCASIHTVNDSSRQQRVAVEQGLEARPGHARTL